MPVQFISSNLFPLSMALISGAMLFWSFFGSRIRGIQVVDCQAALQLMNHKDAIILDVREASEFKAGHILNAKLIPLGKLTERIGELEKYRDRPMIVVCRSGNRSSSACALLVKQGFTQAYNLTGGMMAWQNKKFPSVT
ncbi:MAG: rhodanese-like domain-containing protein [Gallionella sp.]|nr:rhodanese-like domain-containing protein [Gallionella sp.]MDD4959972.1 rhodanese-like domain-containing protein [Gallionella sp.]